MRICTCECKSLCVGIINTVSDIVNYMITIIIVYVERISDVHYSIINRIKFFNIICSSDLYSGSSENNFLTGRKTYSAIIVSIGLTIIINIISSFIVPGIIIRINVI